MATIKQIAQLAGVSPTTVSNVLNGNAARMTAHTREKVETILREQNYAPNMAAHILGQNRSRIVGVIMFLEPRRNETVLEDPFYSMLLGSIEAELRHSGYYMMVHTTCDENEVFRVSWAWKLAGLIIVGVPSDIVPDLLESVESPTVLVDSRFDGTAENYGIVNLEDKRGTYELGLYLISMGHREMAYLGTTTDLNSNDRDRLRGLGQAMEEQGFPPSSVQCFQMSKDREERNQMYRQLADPAMACTVLAFNSDYHAAEAISYFRDIGIRVPQDISVTGFDDNVFSRIVEPQLTTIHQDVNIKGKTAVDLLLALVKKEKPENREINLPIRLVIRKSVGRV